MGIVYVVSPDYLQALCKESVQFSFSIKAYCSIEQGIKNLYKTNVKDIIGFTLVLEELPTELTPVIDFINKVNAIAEGKTFVLYLANSEGFDTLRKYIDISNLKFYLARDVDTVTDSVIKQMIFGQIIKNNVQPYYREIKPKDYEPYVFNTSRYSPILPPNILKIFSDIPMAPDERRAVEADTVLRDFDAMDDDLLYLLRAQRIAKAFNNESPNFEAVYNKLIAKEEDRSKINLLNIVKDFIEDGR